MASSLPTTSLSSLPADVRAEVASHSSTPTPNYLIAAFETRLPTLSIADFKHYYDTIHVPLIKQLMGESFPLSHARHYLKRQLDPNPSDAPVVFGGKVEDFDYDVITIMTFEDEAHLQGFYGKYQDPEIGGKIVESAGKFIVNEVLRIVGVESPSVTYR